MDKLSAILALRPPTVLRVVRLFCHPAEEIPPRKPRALIAARGDATGLPMDRTKSRALCNPPSSAPSPATVALNIHPGPSCPQGAGCTRFFQFARVVHSTGDRKILGKENSFSSTSLSSSSASVSASSLSLLSYLFFRRLLSKRTGVPDLCIAWPFDPCIVVKYVYNTCTMRSENSAHCTYTERTDCCVHSPAMSHHTSSYCTIFFVRQLLKTTQYEIIKFNIYT